MKSVVIALTFILFVGCATGKDRSNRGPAAESGFKRGEIYQEYMLRGRELSEYTIQSSIQIIKSDYSLYDFDASKCKLMAAADPKDKPHVDCPVVTQVKNGSKIFLTGKDSIIAFSDNFILDNQYRRAYEALVTDEKNNLVLGFIYEEDELRLGLSPGNTLDYKKYRKELGR